MITSPDRGSGRGRHLPSGRLRNPDSEVFALTVEWPELPGERCVFADDVAHYLPAARALGLATIRATDPATTVAVLKRIFGSHPLRPAT